MQKKKFSKPVNLIVLKNKTKQKKHISNSNTKFKIEKKKLSTTQMERKNILTRNEDEKIGRHGQPEIQEI